MADPMLGGVDPFSFCAGPMKSWGLQLQVGVGQGRAPEARPGLRVPHSTFHLGTSASCWQLPMQQASY